MDQEIVGYFFVAEKPGGLRSQTARTRRPHRHASLVTFGISTLGKPRRVLGRDLMHLTAVVSRDKGRRER